MRVCHVITKPELGGAQISTLNTLKNLPKDKYELFFITSSRGVLAPDFRGLKGIKGFFSPFLTRSINPIYDILAFIHIYVIYKSNNINVIHTHSSKAGILGRWAALLYSKTSRLCKVESVKCKVFHTVHGWSFNDYQPLFLKRLSIFFERATARFTTKIICVSKKDIESGLKYRIAEKEKFVFIKYGIPLDDFKKKSINKTKKRKELGINNNDPVVGMIACLKPQKSPMDYIRACVRIYEKTSRINFLLIGDGVLRVECERLLRFSPLNGRFIFTGWRRDISEILDILDVLVLTSKWEGMPIVIIEALSKGCPVVATAIGGTQELVKDGISGYLVRPGIYDDVARKTLSILNDSNMLEGMKNEAALSIDGSFKLDRMISEIEYLYRRST